MRKLQPLLLSVCVFGLLIFPLVSCGSSQATPVPIPISEPTTTVRPVDLPRVGESDQAREQPTLRAPLSAGGGTHTPIPTAVPSRAPAPSGACSPVDYSEVPELLRYYARGVACIQADGRQGTGFVVRNTAAGHGYLLTNAHVVEASFSVSIYLDNAAYSAEVVKTSVERDLAMVRICCGDFVVLKRANRFERLGESIWAMGFPGGAFAYPNGVARAWIDRPLNRYVEHTAGVQAGGSGGPLLAFPYEAVLRAVEGKGWSLEEGESLSVLGVTSAKSLEHEYTTYALHSHDVSQFVGSVWDALGLERTDLPTSTTPQFTLDW